MFQNLTQLPPDPIFNLLSEYKSDPRPNKVNLGIGIYTTEEGDPFVCPTVKKAFREVNENDFNYQPLQGMPSFMELSAKLILGDTTNIALQATCGGTQACRMMNDLISTDSPNTDLLVATPTWGNHFAVFKDLNHIKFDHLTPDGSINPDSYHQVIESAKPNSVLLLHGGLTHNPTGLNLKLDQIKELIPKIREKQIFVFIDAAYLGFGEGFEEDCEYVRIFFRELPKVAVGVSFSKNASLYEHRTGLLMVKCESESEKNIVSSQLQQINRASVSMVPGIGQEIMSNVLTNYESDWITDIDQMRTSIDTRKNSLLDKLPDQFAKMRQTRGMFGFAPLSLTQIRTLKTDHAIYILENTRVNFAGIKTKDIDYIAKSIIRL